MALLPLRLPPKGWNVNTPVDRAARPCWIYLDHNVLDSMLKGHLSAVKRRLRGDHAVAVYSNVNLDEIARSDGHEAAFLDLLREIRARYLVSLVDDQFVPTGNAEIRVVDPHDAYAAHHKTLAESPKGGFALGLLLQKIYGGHPSLSYDEIFAIGRQELIRLLRQTEETSASDPRLGPAERELLSTFMTGLRRRGEVAIGEAAEFAAAHTAELSIRAFEDGTGLRPLDLNNIAGPDIVGQIWHRFKMVTPNCDVDPDAVFQLKATPWSPRPDREPTIMEKVNALYHGLNFLGYYRDSDMKEELGFHRSFRDMSHAGMASFCHVLLTGDKRMAMKTLAAYEYLGVLTRVRYLRPGRPWASVGAGLP